MVMKQPELLLISSFPSNMIKLKEDNFLLWKSQILTTLKEHGLEKFLQRKKPTVIVNEDNSEDSSTEDNGETVY